MYSSSSSQSTGLQRVGHKVDVHRFYPRKPFIPTDDSQKRPAESEPPFQATPHRGSSATSEVTVEREKASIQLVTASLEAELMGHWVALGSHDAVRKFLLDRLALSVCPIPGGWAAAVAKFRRDRSLSGHVVFEHIDAEPAKEEKLYKPYIKLFRAVAFKLRLDKTLIGLDTHNTIIGHAQYLGVTLGTKPDLVVIDASAAAYDETKRPPAPIASYTNIRTVFEAKKGTTSIVDVGLQIGVYARQIMAEQPTRRFVIAFAISGRQIRLYCFDRCGVMYSDAIDIRIHEDILIYAISLAFADSHAIGMDPTITPPFLRVIDQDKGKKIKARELRMSNAVVLGEGAPDSLYELAADPLDSGHTIRGRATICWRTTDGRYVIKDYWRAVERPFEADFLVSLYGVRGVGQLHAYQDNLERVSDFRGPNRLTNDAARIPPGVTAEISDRVHCRQVLDAYTGDLSYAPNPLVLVIAFRDAVEGHRNALLDKNILHRDVSLFNVMYDRHARDGVLGRLIDFDLAKKLEILRTEPRTTGDLRTGTRMYQSIKILLGRPEVLGRHDHMDDLESFFYVLIHISLVHGGGALPMDAYKYPQAIIHWNQSNPEISASFKRNVFTNDLWSLPVTLGLRAPLLPLLLALRVFFQERVSDVANAIAPFEPKPMPRLNQNMDDYLVQARDDYDRFLGILNVHIEHICAMNSDWKGELDEILAGPSSDEDESQRVELDLPATRPARPPPMPIYQPPTPAPTASTGSGSQSESRKRGRAVLMDEIDEEYDEKFERLKGRAVRRRATSNVVDYFWQAGHDEK